MSERRTKLFQKQWDLVMALQRHARGISRKRLIEVTGLPSTTLHRCIGELRAYGVPIETRTRNGEAWHCVEHAALPALGITAPQLLALRFSRRMLAPLEGTQITREIDALLQPHALRDSPESAVSLRATAPSAPKIVDVIERAIQQRRERILLGDALVEELEQKLPELDLRVRAEGASPWMQPADPAGWLAAAGRRKALRTA